MVQYTAEQKAKYYADNPDKLKAKLEREAKKGAKAPMSGYKKKALKPAPKKNAGNAKMSLTAAQKEMSPFGKDYPPLNPNSLGNFTTFTTMSRHTLSTSTTNTKVFVFMPSIRGIYQAAEWDGVTGVESAPGTMSPTYRFATADTPTSMRPLRSGLRIRNTTSNQDVGGIVRVLQQSSPIEWDFVSGSSTSLTSAMVGELTSACETNPKSVEYSAHSLCFGTNEFVIAPATSSAYNSYGNQFTASTGAANFQAELNSMINDMPMNILIITFEPTSVVNTYSITMCDQLALRYPTNTVLNEMAKPHRKPTDARSSERIHEILQNGGTVVLTE